MKFQTSNLMQVVIACSVLGASAAVAAEDWEDAIPCLGPYTLEQCESACEYHGGTFIVDAHIQGNHMGCIPPQDGFDGPYIWFLSDDGGDEPQDCTDDEPLEEEQDGRLRSR